MLVSGAQFQNVQLYLPPVALPLHRMKYCVFKIITNLSF